MLRAQQEKEISLNFKSDKLKDIGKDADAIVRKNLKAFTLPSQNLPTKETNRQICQRNPSFEIKNKDTSEPNLNNSNSESQPAIDFENFSIFNYVVKDESGFKLHFDNDISEEECRYYLKLFPDVNSIREKKTHCTSCNVHLGCAPKNEPNIRMHPILKVTLCKKCFDFYNSGEFSKGEDGSELYCRWCGQGGEVYCCAKCPYVFCKGCISLNLSKNLVNDIQENENWNCFVCAPKITWPVRAAHWALANFLRKQKNYIMNGDHTEVQKRNLMRKDVSQCCPERRSNLKEFDEEDDDIPLAKTIKIASKRKLSSSDSESGVKPAGISTQITGKTTLTIQPAAKKTKSDPIATRPTIIASPQPNKQFILNNKLIINQVTPQQAQIMAKTTPPSQVGQVKIIQMSTQSSNLMQKLPTAQQQNQRLPMIQPRLPIIQQKLPCVQTQSSQPPPLLIRNRGVQIRPTNLVANPRPAISTARSSSEQTPVYHTIGGYCIDLNSAAQHDSIRLPNGKLIQVKKSTTSNTLSNANGRNQNGSLQTPLQSSQQHHFTITQPAYPLQTAAAPAPIVSNAPPTTGTIHVVNGNQIQMPLQIQQPNTTMIQQQGPRPPVLMKHIFNQTQIGKARSQLQNQIFTAMEICQHLSGKVQTLTNSNPYKNAATLGDVKELYIHLSYLFTYAIGRFKTVQEKCNEDMKNIGYRADHTKLVKGHLAAEKEQTSDTEEGELELIEPQTTTIDLDSDNEDNLASTSGINSQQISQQAVIAQNNASNLTEQEQDDYNVTFDLLAGMLEVNLTEDPQSLSNFNKPKHPRKKTTHRPNPALIKQQHEKYEQIKLNDLKLQQKCNILIEYFDLSKSQIQSAMERYYKQQDKNDGLSNDDAAADDDHMNYENQYELLNMLQVEVNDFENQSREKDKSKCVDEEDHTNDKVDDSTEPSSENNSLFTNSKDKDKDMELESKENDTIGTDHEEDLGNTSAEINQLAKPDLNKENKNEENLELADLNKESKNEENLELADLNKESKNEENLDLPDLNKESKNEENLDLPDLNKESKNEENLELADLNKESKNEENLELADLNKESKNEENLKLAKSISNDDEDVESSNRREEDSKSEKLLEQADDNKTNNDDDDESNTIEASNEDANNSLEASSNNENNALEANNDDDENNALEASNDDEINAIESSNDDEVNAIETINDNESNNIETINQNENISTETINDSENIDDDDRNSDNGQNNDNDENNNNDENNDNNEENNNNDDNDNTENEINNSENNMDVTDDSAINISDDVEMISLDNNLNRSENESENKEDVNNDITEKINENLVSEILDSLSKSSDN